MVFLLPRVRTIVRAQNIASNDFKILSKLVFKFALPLERQTSGSDDECSLNKSANFQLLQEQTGHDRFAGAGIIRKEEANSR